MLYDRIKQLCDERHIAVTALEAALGFGRGSIGKLKNGKTPNAERVQKIADYFDMPVSYLLTGETDPAYYEDPETAALAQKMKDDKDFRLLFSAAKDAAPETLQAVYDVLIALKKRERGEE